MLAAEDVVLLLDTTANGIELLVTDVICRTEDELSTEDNTADEVEVICPSSETTVVGMRLLLLLLLLLVII